MTDDLQQTRRPPTSLSESVAAGRPVGRSHRLHRPRGGFCARGYCQQCPLADGGLACETPSDRAGHPAPDLLRPLGLAGERMEPWFYETRFLRPRFARQWMLTALRRLSSAPSLPSSSIPAAGPVRELRTDVLVVGGGPTGLSAAAAAARTTSTILVTRAVAGGSLPQDAPTRHRVADDLAAIVDAGATVIERAMCIGRYEQEDRFVVVSADGPIAIQASRCVIATGAYDRPLLVEGADLPGVMGLRAFQLLAAEGAVGNRRIGAVGGREEVRRARETAGAFGVQLAWSLGEQGPADPNETVRRIEGRRRARGVRLGDGRLLRADVVVMATTQPTYELQVHLGGVARLQGSPPVIRVDTPRGYPCLVVGEAAGWSGVGGTGNRAAAATMAWLDGGDVAIDDGVEPAPELGPRIDVSPDAVVCVCEDVRRHHVDRAIAEGFDDMELVKRRSGATTGACQGKLCLALLAETFTARGLAPGLPTVRPPIRPVSVASLGGGE
jgi:sarcosine oxidase subunit alpha